MKNYLTIGEIAKIRKINAKSLRYYEKIGIFKPAYVHPETGYRYYSPEQIKTLELIQICTIMGIPLKEFKDFLESNREKLKFEKLLQKGKEDLLRQRQRVDITLRLIEHSLHHIESYRNTNHTQDQYIMRKLRSREIVRFPYNGKLDWVSITAKLTEFNITAAAAGIIPVIPYGVIFEYQNESLQTYVYWELPGHTPPNEWMASIPEGEYLCLQESINQIYEPEKLFSEQTKNKNSWIIIVTDVYSSETSLEQVILEYQLLLQ